MRVECGDERKVYTAEDYLFGCVNFPVAAEGVKAVLAGRGIEPRSEYATLPDDVRDLLRADLFVWICLGPSKMGATSDSDNGWSHSEGAYTLSSDDKDRMMAYAYSIYDAYEEEPPYDDRVQAIVSSYGVMHCDYDMFGNPLPHTIGF